MNIFQKYCVFYTRVPKTLPLHEKHQPHPGHARAYEPILNMNIFIRFLKKDIPKYIKNYSRLIKIKNLF